MASLKKNIYKKLEKAFKPEKLEIIDDSHYHKHHKEAPEGEETHFSILMISSMFSSLSRVERHQAVYQTLSTELKGGLHALSLKLYAPEEDKSRETQKIKR